MANAIDPIHRLEPLGVPVMKVGQILRRHAWVILLVVVVGVGGCGAVVFNMAPRYTASTSVLVEPRRTQVSDLQAISNDPENAPNMMKTQIDILRSPALAQRVVTALGLMDLAEFTGGPSLSRKLLTMAQQLLGLPGGDIVPPSENETVRKATEALLERIYFGNEPRSNVLRIFAETGNPELSAKVTNEFARQFLDFKRHQKFAATQRAHEWFQERLRELAVNVRGAEVLVQEYREKHGLTDVPTSRSFAPAGPSINSQQLAEVSRRFVVVVGERARKEAQLEEATALMRVQGRPDAVPAVLSSVLIQRLREQEAVVAGREAELAATIGERSPDLLQARSHRRGLQRRIQEEMASIIVALRSELNASRAEEKAVHESLNQLRAAVSAENVAEVRLNGLLAEAQASRSIYESFLSRATQLANVAGIQEPDAELVSPATAPPSPSAPKPVRLLAVALLVCLVIGVAIAFLLERMRTGYSSAEDLEADLGVPAIGVIPNAPLARLAGNSKAMLQFTAAMSKVRGGLQVLEERRRPKVLMVTSAMPREGKSIFALSLARNAAKAGWRTLLIDCDMRMPTVANRLGISAERGLHHLLTLDPSVEAISLVHRMPTSGLHVLPSGVSDVDPQDLLASLRMTQLLQDARQEYDLIILDAPPVLPVADALVLARQADATVLAVRWEKTARAPVRTTLRLLQGSSARVLGAVLTNVDRRAYAVLGGPGAANYLHRSYLRRSYNTPAV